MTKQRLVTFQLYTEKTPYDGGGCKMHLSYSRLSLPWDLLKNLDHPHIILDRTSAAQPTGHAISEDDS